jgi:transcriptional regulator GlxA family with amidase domain
MRLLIREVRADRPQRAEAIRAALDMVAVEVGRSIVAAQERDLLPRHPSVADACRLLEQHSEKPWRLHELGKFVGLSPNHLATLFKNELGTTPHQYLLQARIAKACSLLRTTDMSVTDIAFEVGFTSSQHFARVFRKLENISARNFRRKTG